MKKIIKRLPLLSSIYKTLNNQFQRDDFVKSELEKLKSGMTILDAGCGSQRYKKYTSHLFYKGQDFGQYKSDEKDSLLALNEDYDYGELDYQCDIWSIPEKDNTFDAILCTEVFEHIPYPNDTIKEFRRLLKQCGTLILTVPSNSMRHFDPYYFYSGFSDRWITKILEENGFRIITLNTIGDYYRYMAIELARTMISRGIIGKFFLLPAFFYFFCKQPSTESINTLCYGYNVVARKI